MFHVNTDTKFMLRIEKSSALKSNYRPIEAYIGRVARPVPRITQRHCAQRICGRTVLCARSIWRLVNARL